MRLLLPVATLALLAFAPSADASILKFDVQQKKVSYEAAAGEVNEVTATHEGSLVRLHDPGATITIQGTACTAVSANEATCPVADPRHVVKVDGGDLDDHLSFTGALSAQLEGADGDDTLTGSGGADKLDGGTGADALDGRGGIDEYSAGDGADTLRLQDGAADTVACGGGADAATFDPADVLADDCEFKPAPVAPLDPVAPGAGLAETGQGPASGDLAGADPAALAALPAPRPGRAVSAAPGRGTVRVRRPGSAAFRTLDPTRPVPVGTIVDARNGSVTIVAAKDLAGATQKATFAGGVFRVTQRRAKAMTTVLTLRGALDCGSNRSTAVAAAAKKRRSRSLWGDGHGRFTTRGRNSHATVRGTRWGVTDRCDGTLTEVKRGVVAVKDLRTKKTRLVRAGGRYLARNRT